MTEIVDFRLKIREKAGTLHFMQGKRLEGGPSQIKLVKHLLEIDQNRMLYWNCQ